MKIIKTTKELETRLEQILRYVEDAERKAQAETAKLYDAQGRERYAPHVMSEMFKGIAEQYAEAVKEFVEEVEGWRLQAESHRKVTRLDPFVLFDEDELQRAGLLAPLAALTVDVTPLPELAERLTAIAALGELPDKLAYLRAAERRAVAEKPQAGPDATAQPSGQTGRLEFQQALDHLREASVHPKVKEATELAAALHQAATQVTIAARKGDPKAAQRREMAAAQAYSRF